MSENFVVDNSVVMSWCFKDEINPYADSILDRLADSTAFVPPIWPLEVINVLLVAERRQRLSEADSTRFIELLGQLPITVEQEQPEKIMRDIWALAKKYKLSSYDASYLDLAMRKGLPIATLDNNLRTAARKSRVSIFGG
ncbi:MAG: type II toxin-antitoxin system VapC family toxin [Pseudomonadota bacterium]